MSQNKLQSSAAPSLCLGTAQFGLPYGITNQKGKVPLNDVRSILSLAYKNDLHWLDTAQAYGDAEKNLGTCLQSHYDFRIVSKLLPNNKSCFSIGDVADWQNSFRDTLRNIGSSSIHTLLIHSPNDLRKEGSNFLYTWLNSIRDSGLVNRIGISIYESTDLIGVETNFFDCVQLPLSLFDQRLLLNGTIDNLISKGIKIHARSVYLQGLLLTPSTSWPNWIDIKGRQHKTKLELLAMEKNCTEIDLALSFVKSQSYLEAVVVGVCSPNQLKQLLLSWSSQSPWMSDDWKSWSINDSNCLDPRKWPE